MRPKISAKEGCFEFEVSRRFYHAGLLPALADELRPRARMTWRVGPKRIRVAVRAPASGGAEELWTLAGELANEWLNRECRGQRLRAGRSEASSIVARAFSSALGETRKAESAR